MSRKTFLFCLSIFLLSILFSCDLEKNECNNRNLTVVWERNLSSGSEVLDIESKTLFFENLDDNNLGMGALNVETGETLWLSKKIGYNSGQGLFDDLNVYAMNYVRKDKENEVYENLITIIDKENGKIKSQNKISGSTPRRSSQWTLYNDTLYWGGRDRHFVHAYNTQDDADSYKVWGSEDVTADIMGGIHRCQADVTRVKTCLWTSRWSSGSESACPANAGSTGWIPGLRRYLSRGVTKPQCHDC